MHRGNCYADLPDASDGEKFETLAMMGNDSTLVERIVSESHSSPPGFWYDQETDEWVVVLTGGAEIQFSDPPGEERLGKGDWLLIPARRRHRVRSTLPGTLWLAVHAKRDNQRE